jgi:hypothetical protein
MQKRRFVWIAVEALFGLTLICVFSVGLWRDARLPQREIVLRGGMRSGPMERWQTQILYGILVGVGALIVASAVANSKRP